jgi:hypothetical protein
MESGEEKHVAYIGGSKFLNNNNDIDSNEEIKNM